MQHLRSLFTYTGQGCVYFIRAQRLHGGLKSKSDTRNLKQVHILGEEGGCSCIIGLGNISDTFHVMLHAVSERRVMKQRTPDLIWVELGMSPLDFSHIENSSPRKTKVLDPNESSPSYVGTQTFSWLVEFYHSSRFSILSVYSKKRSITSECWNKRWREWWDVLSLYFRYAFVQHTMQLQRFS